MGPGIDPKEHIYVRDLRTYVSSGLCTVPARTCSLTFLWISRLLEAAIRIHHWTHGSENSWHGLQVSADFTSFSIGFPFFYLPSNL